MGYSRTTWNEGAAPGIDAVKLNKIEQGIADLWAGMTDLVNTTADLVVAAGHMGKIIEVESASARLVTIPTFAESVAPVGSKFVVVGAGAGLVTIATSGPTLRTASTLVLNGQWAAAGVYRRTSDEWVVLGNLQPV